MNEWIVYATCRRTKKRKVFRLFDREEDAILFCLDHDYRYADGYKVYDLEIEFEGDD